MSKRMRYDGESVRHVIHSAKNFARLETVKFPGTSVFISKFFFSAFSERPAAVTLAAVLECFTNFTTLAQ